MSFGRPFGTSFADDQYAPVAIPTHSAVDLRAGWQAAPAGQRSQAGNHKKKKRREKNRKTRN